MESELAHLLLGDGAVSVLALHQGVDGQGAHGQLQADVELHGVPLVVHGGAVAEEGEQLGHLLLEALRLFIDPAAAQGVQLLGVGLGLGAGELLSGSSAGSRFEILAPGLDLPGDGLKVGDRLLESRKGGHPVRQQQLGAEGDDVMRAEPLALEDGQFFPPDVRGLFRDHVGQHEGRELAGDTGRRPGDGGMDLLDPREVLLVEVGDEDDQIGDLDGADGAQVRVPRARVDEQDLVAQLVRDCMSGLVEERRSGSLLGVKQCRPVNGGEPAGIFAVELSREEEREPAAAGSERSGLEGEQGLGEALRRERVLGVDELADEVEGADLQGGIQGAQVGDLLDAGGFEIQVPDRDRPPLSGELHGGLDQGEAPADAPLERVEGDDHAEAATAGSSSVWKSARGDRPSWRSSISWKRNVPSSLRFAVF